MNVCIFLHLAIVEYYFINTMSSKGSLRWLSLSLSVYCF